VPPAWPQPRSAAAELLHQATVERSATTAQITSTTLLMGHRTDDLPITSRMLGVDRDGSRRIWPAHVGRPVGPDGSRRIQKDRLDDQAHPTKNRMPRRATLWWSVAEVF
jgi:hypothetical protein